MTSQAVKIINGGKIVIPASFRRALGLAAGDTVVVELAGEELRLRSQAQALSEARAILRRHVPEEQSLTDELIRDRRDSARGE
ncbi:AbrB/MazE/SpoVT family DNA-binding domain-containing protein [Chthonobacter albigriseus]|jgi:AbrB family looped-hinge helix DNA binding protein|uniref:AbrB/MazE/SpoVT family DNA-binding domain-containing protein n=1 Tax=Chthonobacter albigriseus TaxID=1683161 RepID=UPI0015EECD97|nr:AbrB/MazE/SpoVT family DNA-binding domain-containing protein [Chthonobacter albigriseus]